MPKTKTGGKPATTTLPPLPITQPEIHHHYYAKPAYRFDFGKLSFGLFLIVVGILYLAKNFGWLNIELSFNPLELWPLLIVFIGLSLITSRSLASIFAGAILTLTVLTIAFLLILGAGDINLQDSVKIKSFAPIDSAPTSDSYFQPATSVPLE